jgi:hypothetical protein
MSDRDREKDRERDSLNQTLEPNTWRGSPAFGNPLWTPWVIFFAAVVTRNERVPSGI